jgi:YggT family protein
VTLLGIAVITALAVLIVFFLVMWVRLVFDWARVLKPNWRPRGVSLVLAEAAYAITDPPIKVVRRILPPIRLGGARIEFSWSIVMLACLAMIWAVGLFV